MSLLIGIGGFGLRDISIYFAGYSMKKKPTEKRAKWTAGQEARWTERLEWLEDEFPLGRCVSVHRVAYRRQCGGVFDRDGRFLIHVARRLEYTLAVYTLLEEWAHCREWDDYRDHGHAWTAEYGALIRADEDRENHDTGD